MSLSVAESLTVHLHNVKIFAYNFETILLKSRKNDEHRCCSVLLLIAYGVTSGGGVFLLVGAREVSVR